MQFKYLDRPPVVGDLVVWGEKASNFYTDCNKPYLVLQTSGVQVWVIDKNGTSRQLGPVGRRVISTSPGTEATIGDTVYRIKGDSPDCPLHGTFKVCKGVISAARHYYGNKVSIPKSDTLLIHTTNQSNPPKQEPKMNFPKQPNQRYRVFSSDGSINHKGLIYQELSNDSIDNRPFVQSAIADEVEKTVASIRKTNFKAAAVKHSPKCDIQLLSIISQLHDFKTSDDNEYYDNLKATKLFYQYKKLSAKKTDHSWIQSYLTKENLHSVDPIILFNSNARKIFIQSGSIYYTENWVNYSVPISYNETTRQFYL